MSSEDPLFDYTLRLGDSCIILAQRISEWVGHAPILEEDIGIANIALDLVGQGRLWLDLAGEIEGQGRDADALAYHRDAGAYRNHLLTEQPNGDFGQTIMRQFLFDAWYLPLLKGLSQSNDSRVAAIAEKAAKEASYHHARHTDLVISLGDGTEESHDRMQAALDVLWPYTGEMLTADKIDGTLCEAGTAPDLAGIEQVWNDHVSKTLTAATLTQPESNFMQSGGKAGRHSEHLGFLLAEMQFLQRAYPDAVW